jgi:hypothetical protein
MPPVRSEVREIASIDPCHCQLSMFLVRDTAYLLVTPRLCLSPTVGVAAVLRLRGYVNEQYPADLSRRDQLVHKKHY